MSRQSLTSSEESVEDILRVRIMRLNSTIVGLVIGIAAGLVVFVATNWLVIKGGPMGPEGQPIVGPNLSLLGQFFIGYRVTFVGSLIGFGYALTLGFVGGYTISYIYNWLVVLREHRPKGHD